MLSLMFAKIYHIDDVGDGNKNMTESKKGILYWFYLPVWYFVMSLFPVKTERNVFEISKIVYAVKHLKQDRMLEGIS